MNSSTENADFCRPCEFQEHLDMLRGIKFFSALPLEALKVLAYLCTREKFRPGDILLHQGEDDGQALYVLSGKAQLVRDEPAGDQIIREVEAGEFLGGLSLLGPMPRLFSLKAVEDTRCLVLAREKFTKALEQFPELMPKLIRAMVESIRTWEERFWSDRNEKCRTVCQPRMGVSLL